MANKFFQELKKDHREVESIFKKLQKGDGSRKELFMELKKELQPHLLAEEKVFYPQLMEKEDARTDALESYEEHHVTELLFNEMMKLSMNDERWAAKLKVLDELVKHHIQEEEGKLFKVAEQNLDSAAFDQILQKFQAEKEKLKKNIK